MLELPDVEVVAVDTETSGLFPDDHARVACVALAWDGGSAAFPFDQGVRDKFPTEQLDLFAGDEDPNLGEEEWKELLVWLSQRSLVFHNAKFDLTMMRTGTRHWAGADLAKALYWDTMLGAKELDPLLSKSLDSAAQRAGLQGKDGTEKLEQWLLAHGYGGAMKRRYDLVPWSITKLYVTTDAEQTFALYQLQAERFRAKEADWERAWRELQLLRTLYAMEHRGVGYDAAGSIEAAEELERRIHELELELPFPATAPGAKKYFVGQKGLFTDRVTEKGNPSVDEEQVRRWAAEGVEWAAEYAEVSKYKRAVSMWYRGYPEKLGPDGRLRCSYKQFEVRSGRMSVERVQLQAIPKADKMFEGVPHVRSLLQPRKGFGLWNLDLSQAELRVATKYADCKAMAAMLADGADIHGETCKSVLLVDEDDPRWKEKRDIAKRLTFGSIFQIGGETFQATLSKLADIHLSVEECDGMVRAWRRAYPEFGVAYRKADRLAERTGRVKVLPGTEYEMLSWFSEHDYSNTAWNRIVQGSLAEFFKLWMVEVERQAPGWMILTVHDSVVLECPLDEGDEIARLVADRGAAMASEVFKTDMKVDTDRWGVEPPDVKSRGVDQYGGSQGPARRKGPKKRSMV